MNKLFYILEGSNFSININMLPRYKKLPYKIFPGSIAGSQQPGYSIFDTTSDKAKIRKLDEEFLKKLKAGKHLNGMDEDYLKSKIGIDENLLNDLKYVHEKGIRRIYSLSDREHDRNPELIKIIWEHLFKGTTYVIKLHGILTGIKDFSTPTLKQAYLITEDVIKCVGKGENVLVHCGYGAGRTGTMLADIHSALYPQNTYKVAIAYIRRNYNQEAVETEEQQLSVKSFKVVSDLRALSSHNKSVDRNDLKYVMEKILKSAV